MLYDKLRGEQICTRCGLVIVERSVELEPEWRRKPGQELERADVTAGIDITQHDFGLGSKFGVSEDLPPSCRAGLRRMQLWQKRSRAGTWGERSLREALIELDKFCEDLALPKGIKAEISALYRRTRAMKLTAGRGTHQVLAALTFIICRLRGLPRTGSEISRTLATCSGLGAREALNNLRRLAKFFTRKLKLKLPRISTTDYINRFATQLGLSKQAIERAHELCEVLPKRPPQTKPPLLLAAAILYIASSSTGEKVTIRKITNMMGVGASNLSRTARSIRGLINRGA